VYEVDEAWFAEDEKLRAARALDEKQLAAEMGLHDVLLPEWPRSPAPPEPKLEPEPAREPDPIELTAERPTPDLAVPAVEPSPAPAEQSRPPIEAPMLTAPLADDTGFTAEPVARPLPIALFFGGETDRVAATQKSSGEPRAAKLPRELSPPEPLHVLPPPAHAPSRGVLADDFEALLAFEQGEQSAPPMMMPVVQAVAPEITGEMLDQIAASVAERLKASVRVEAPPPQVTGAMLDQIAATVADRLKGSVHVEPVAPPITDDMLAALAHQVAERLSANVRVEPAAPVITSEMLDRIAGQVGERVHVGLSPDQLRQAFGDAIRQTVADVVRQVVSETSERLVREEIERIKSQAQQS
jgi:hypothetical protein